MWFIGEWTAINLINERGATSLKILFLSKRFSHLKGRTCFQIAPSLLPRKRSRIAFRLVATMKSMCTEIGFPYMFNGRLTDSPRNV